MIVIVASSVIWRVPDRFRDPHTAELAVAQNVDVQFRSYVPSQQVAKFAAMLGTTIDSFAVPLTPAADNTTVSAKCYGGGAEVRRQGPRVLRVTAQCPDTEAVQIGQVYLPLWRVASVARSAQSLLLRSSPAGLIEVVAGAGSHELELVFDGGLPERAGILVTLASTVVVGAGSAVAMVGRMTRTLRTDRRRACHA